MIFCSWKRLNPMFFRKLKKYDRVNIIYFWKGQVQSKCVTSSKHSSDVIKVSSSSKPKTSGTVGFFSKNNFQINKICVEPKYTLQIIALFLNWKQSKKISNDQELIQSDPTSCHQIQKGNN